MDFYLRDNKVTKFRIAYSFLKLEDWLINNDWHYIQKWMIIRLVSLHKKIFGKKILSFKFIISIFFISISLSFIALFVSMYVISENELIIAGFKNPMTPYRETVNELFIEITNKTHSIIPTLMSKFFFDFLAVAVSFSIISYLAKSASPLKLIILMSIDILLSLFFVLLIQISIITFQYSGYMLNIIAKRPTTFLLTSNTTLIFLSSTVTIPVLIYSIILSFIAFIRFIFRILIFVTNKLVDEKQTIFRDFSFFISSIITFFAIFFKILLLSIEYIVSPLSYYTYDILLFIIFKFFVFWLWIAVLTDIL